MATKAKRKPRKKHAKVTVKKYSVSELSEAPYNARAITKQALEGLQASLETLGLLAFPVVNEREDGPRLVGGHQRMKVLRDQGETHVWCVSVKFDEDMERQANFALNNEFIQGSFVPDLTKQVLDSIRDNLSGTELFASLNLDALYKKIVRGIKMPEVDALEFRSDDAGVDNEGTSLPKTKAASKAGAFYKLGKHVLCCGKLDAPGTLAGFPCESTDMAFLPLRAGGQSLSDAYIETHVAHVLENTHGGIYIATTTEDLSRVRKCFQNLGGYYSNLLIWYVRGTTPDPDQPFKCATIPVLYGWRAGTKHMFYGPKSVGNVFTVEKWSKSGLPVEVSHKAMQYSSDKGGTVLNPLVGSGDSVIAAEKAGRALYGYVASPKQLDAVRKRWAEFVHGKGSNWKTATTLMK